ncbi:cellulase family glycosylhydrolase [Anaeromicropila populeti]|uniref:Endoglucanase n=1 Tax=Anaeromicropila populeti TaxID=37658 RepID=A0A1I6LJ78_9FIRM|nr:cellulase family glycosylhydrolase [Anaeromicropila populeti]SFS03509.1 Aryl-phospho-beta-D-glucosidase BglC, GH1 family [Anaeromicropila populeti]
MKGKWIKILILLCFIGCFTGCKKEADSKVTSIQQKEVVEKVEEEETEEAENAENANDSLEQEIKGKETSQKKEEIYLEVTNSNQWENEADQFVQLDLGIVNTSTDKVKDWKITIPVGESTYIEQSWSGNFRLDNNTIVITCVDYNQTVEPSNSITIGAILKNAGIISKEEIILDYDLEQVPESEKSKSSNQKGSDTKEQAVEIKQFDGVPKATQDDWLSVKGNKIVDKSGKEVWLTGVNWFGYNTGTNLFDGIWNSDLNTSIEAIADHGFNLIRIPMSSELILKWKAGEYPAANYNHATNSYLEGMNSLEIFDYVIGQFRKNGLKIMIDIHSAKTDSSGHMYNMWYRDDISEQDFIDSLCWLARRYRKDDTILAYDLKNEPHGKPNETPKAIWNSSTDADNWKYIAEKTAKAVLDINPNVLIMVEGIECYPKDLKSNGNFQSLNNDDYYFNWWGGNLRGVKDYPVDLGKYQNKLVYSPHDYGPSVYQQPWFEGDYTFDSLYEDCWKDNWMFIQEENIAPLLVGEWGGFMKEPNLKWMTFLRELIKKNRLNHTFWCFNANSGDTGGLVLDDFTTWDEEKYEFVKEVLWQKNGKFVGLNHKIPLGKNGITLSE